MALLIKNGTVVTAEKAFPADVLVEGETIREIRPGIPPAPAWDCALAVPMARVAIVPMPSVRRPIFIASLLIPRSCGRDFREA